ncbi:hypothetical protein KAR91_26525, partial [Candidatus Pacearchaeota archaeon]|nr:hypothetical protein [Candidatus Pacearchaeota archaeon]
LEVMDMWCDPHHKEGGLPSMKVTYSTMRAAIREWVCFSHHAFEPGNNKRYAWDKAVAWHKLRLPDDPVPNTVEGALNIPYPTPKRIQVRKEGKYWRILDYEFEPVNDFIEAQADPIPEEEHFQIPF